MAKMRYSSSCFARKNNKNNKINVNTDCTIKQTFTCTNYYFIAITVLISH